LAFCLQLDIALLVQNSVKIWHCLSELCQCIQGVTFFRGHSVHLFTTPSHSHPTRADCPHSQRTLRTPMRKLHTLMRKCRHLRMRVWSLRMGVRSVRWECGQSARVGCECDGVVNNIHATRPCDLRRHAHCAARSPVNHWPAPATRRRRRRRGSNWLIGQGRTAENDADQP